MELKYQHKLKTLRKNELSIVIGNLMQMSQKSYVSLER